MKQELAWGSAAAVAIVAAVGISSQPGSKSNPSDDGQSRKADITTRVARETAAKGNAQPQCADSVELLDHFVLHEKITGPESCYGEKHPSTPLPPKFQTTFIIATLPDPLHTHFSLQFDRYIEAVQQGAQDEHYTYDSSWLPWETEEQSYSSMKDQDAAEDRKAKREAQPGMLLFRGPDPALSEKNLGVTPYQKALIVFVVGEETTGGIHREQFENAVAWIRALQPASEAGSSVAILGPSSSGSFPSLSDLLSKTGLLADNKSTSSGREENRLAVYSGGTSSRKDGLAFSQTKGIDFRSFVRDDTTALDLLCRYFAPNGSPQNLAILSEDETAYGYSETGGKAPDVNPRKGATPTPKDALAYPRDSCGEAPIKVFYPRDISTLRAAYQNQSMFISGSGQLNQDSVQRKSLPTDLLDPAGRQHDTVRTYASNQTPLSQEAQLLGIVEVLRSHRVKYVIIRSSNTLDSLFLANFLRRDYPEARIMLLNSDLLFQRGQDALALSGVMTLSTYPLFSWARDWTPMASDSGHTHRVFGENSTEGLYIASRLILQRLRPPTDERSSLGCALAEKGLPISEQQVFAPPLRCEGTELPDYAPPFWMDPMACQSDSSATTCRPPIWLSVITKHGVWPLAALNDRTLLSRTSEKNPPPSGPAEQRKWPGIPRTTRMALVVLCGLAMFHLLCCRFASFTGKPAFRAHFATAGRRHLGLVLIGSYLVALLGLLIGWGSGLFETVAGPPGRSWLICTAVLFIWIVAAVSVAVNIVATRKLNGDLGNGSHLVRRIGFSLALFVGLTVTFFLLYVLPLERALVLANRTFVYWRCMNLTSGVSPLVPFLAMAGGLYFWFWYALHGLALFGPDRPCLPPLDTLGVKLPTPAAMNHGSRKELKLSMFSQENVAVPAERIAKPLSSDNVFAILILFALTTVLMFGLTGGHVPIRNLGTMQGNAYSVIFCLALCFYCSFLLSEAWQLWRTWGAARQLLVFLDRMALRRTLSALHGFSWGTVWKMSGNVLDVRYKLLSRQLECLNHLYNSMRLFKMPEDADEQAAFAGIETCKKAVNLARAEGLRFAEWYSKNYCKPDAADLQKFQDFQKQIAETTGIILTELVAPATRVEELSLIQLDPNDTREQDLNGPPQSKYELIRNAEELVCLTYLGFAQNLLGRIRTIVLGGVYLFIALSVAVSSYPFDPSTFLSGILLLLFVAFGGVVFFTYADMHRDTTLSHVTNTKPGELGSEFWFKVLGYGAAPLLGLITQVFPEWSGFLFSWLQPGLSSLK
jgi:hypothetical protein